MISALVNQLIECGVTPPVTLACAACEGESGDLKKCACGNLYCDECRKECHCEDPGVYAYGIYMGGA